MIKVTTDASVVVAQLTAFSLLVFLSDPRAVIADPYLVAIVSVGMILLVGSRLMLGSQSYSPLSRPRNSSVFRDQGIYGYIRHPIYLGLMTVGLAFLLVRPTLGVVLAYALVLLVTNIRADLEEGLLEERYPEYRAYKERTKRFIPLVF